MSNTANATLTSSLVARPADKNDSSENSNLDYAAPDGTIAIDSTPHASSNAANQAGSCFSPMKNPLSFDEQLEHILDKGMSLGKMSKASAIEYLKTLNYYRISGFWITFLDEQREGYFVEGTELQQVIDIVTFDTGMRVLILDALESIEIKFRTQFAYHMAQAYGADALSKGTAFKNRTRYENSKSAIDREINQAKKSRVSCVLHNLNTYGSLPIWASVEVLSLGTLSKLYGNLAEKQVKEDIAQSFGVTSYYFKSWIEYLTQVRNMCAHFNRLYNRVMVKTPALHVQNKSIDSKREFPIFLILVCLLDSSWPDRAKTLINDLQKLIEEYPDVDLGPVGFPDDWKQFLMKNCRRENNGEPI